MHIDTVKSTLLIDKMSLTLPITDPQRCEAIRQNLFSCAKDTEFFQNCSASHSIYKVNVAFYVGPNKSRVLIQAVPKSKGPFFRLDFNPDKLGPEGMEELRSIMDSMLMFGWTDLVQEARVSRLDIAVDFQGITPSDLHVMPNRMVTSTTYQRDGLVESIYLGRPKSQKQIRIYDKAKEIASKGGVPAHPVLTRLERALRNGPYLLNLHAMDCPLSDFEVVSLSGKAPGLKDHEWKSFVALALSKGVTPALNIYPKAKRAAFKKALKDKPVGFWDPDALWKGWVPLIQTYGLQTSLHTYGESPSSPHSH